MSGFVPERRSTPLRHESAREVRGILWHLPRARVPKQGEGAAGRRQRPQELGMDSDVDESSADVDGASVTDDVPVMESWALRRRIGPTPRVNTVNKYWPAPAAACFGLNRVYT